MITFTDPQHFEPFQGGYLAIGNFDGVHRGHRAMIDRLKQAAGVHQVPATVVSFDPPPVAILAPEKTPPQLSTLERKIELLEGTNIDCHFVIQTTRELLNLSARDFFHSMIQQHFGAIGLVEGPNFFFGKNREGSIETLQELCSEQTLDLIVVDPTIHQDEMISSTRIRRSIANGSMSESIEMLGHPYQITGMVSRGSQRGQTLGIPTANLTEIRTLLPGHGVYAGYSIINDITYPAAINIGPNPTFQENQNKVEVHLIGFSGDLYDQILSVNILDRCRDIISFQSSDELKQQMQTDIEKTKQLVQKFLSH